MVGENDKMRGVGCLNLFVISTQLQYSGGVQSIEYKEILGEVRYET